MKGGTMSISMSNQLDTAIIVKDEDLPFSVSK